MDLTAEEKAALPARFHTPAFDNLGRPNAWLCRVCWGDGWVTQWPCATAQKHGAEVFTADHLAEDESRKQAAQLEQARTIAVELENENARLATELERHVGHEPAAGDGASREPRTPQLPDRAHGEALQHARLPQDHPARRPVPPHFAPAAGRRQLQRALVVPERLHRMHA